MPADIQTNKLFLAARIALIATAMIYRIDRAEADTLTGSDTFIKVAVVPAISLVVFIVIYMSGRKEEQSVAQSFANSIA